MNGKYVVVDEWNAVNAGVVISVSKRPEAEICGLCVATTEGGLLLRWPADQMDARDTFYKLLAEMMQKVE